MPASHQNVSGSSHLDIPLPQLPSNYPNATTVDERERHLQSLIQQGNSNFDDDSDDSGSVNISNSTAAGTNDRLLTNNLSDLTALPISKGRLHQSVEAINDNKNKRQKLGTTQSHSSQNLLKKGIYPTTSKYRSPQPMETPPLSRSQQGDFGGMFSLIKAKGLQPIPPFRRNDPPKTLRTQEKQTPVNDKENTPISAQPSRVHVDQQLNENDLERHQHENHHHIEQKTQQKDTNDSDGRISHSTYTEKLSIYRDTDDDNGKAITNHKKIAKPLSSVDINLPDRLHSHIQSHQTKQQNGLDHQQQQNDHAPSFSERQHHPEDSEPPSTKDQLLTGDVRVKKRLYTIIKKIGNGGSATVYMVINKESSNILALKHVVTEPKNEDAVRNEVNFFKLYQDQCPKMCRMHNYEYDKSVHELKIVLDLGEMDFATKLEMEKSKPLNMNFVRYHGQQIVEAVAEMHDANVIHRDLKPANFILKQGSLKLIDFGISKWLPPGAETKKITDSTGTINYMSPESLTVVGVVVVNKEKKEYTRIGKPSDIWALGCILYQMIYGHTPFQAIRTKEGMKRRAICDPTHKIDYPDTVKFQPTNETTKIGKDVVGILKCCLDRNASLRFTARQLLEHPFFHPSSSSL